MARNQHERGRHAGTPAERGRQQAQPLPRGHGDEHGGYIVDAEAEHTVADGTGRAPGGAATPPAGPGQARTRRASGQ